MLPKTEPQNPDEREYAREIQLATLNILDDFNTEKSRLEEMQRAVLNILDDFTTERVQMQDMPRALLNILEDLNESNDELQKSRDELEQRVIARTAELARSNAELEQFAYIASHDLQEPLRMVSSYVQLLEQRYKGKLDQDADDFIHYATDGAKRMQGLINDLLAYSRVGTRGGSFAWVSLEKILEQALENLHMRIKESGAVITRETLPIIFGDANQLTQVFQNLIDNAIKFRGDEVPRIQISAEVKQTETIVSVADNGIGIAPEYREKIFLIFQRLHTRRDYPGTGIGLAICKRIIERHGGRIWVESAPDKGSTFRFILPLPPRSNE